jgi:predicted enzyme related to lactoylglutathione lyase
MTGRLVHLELHTGDLPHARDFYAQLLDWRPERVQTRAGAYLAMTRAGDLSAGIVECRVRRPVWLPYAEVADLEAAVTRARKLGAAVLLSPREGPAGWRSVLTLPGAGDIALWQPKSDGERDL